MRNRQPPLAPLIIAEVPMPCYPLLIPQEGTTWLSGKLTNPVEQFRLEDHALPPGLYKTVRNDLARYSTIPVSRVALHKRANEYIGVIDSDGSPFFFALNSLGMMTRKAEDTEQAWKAFDELMDVERKAGLHYKREKSDRDLNATVAEFSDVFKSRVKPYGHIAYQRRSKSGKMSMIKPKGTKPTEIPDAPVTPVSKVTSERRKRPEILDDNYGPIEDDHNRIHEQNPFKKKDDPVAYLAHKHLRFENPRDKNAALFHLRRFVRKHSSKTATIEDIEKDANALHDYLSERRVFKAKRQKLKGNFDRHALITALGKAHDTHLYDLVPDPRVTSVMGLDLKVPKPTYQLPSFEQKALRDYFCSLIADYGIQRTDGHTAGANVYNVINVNSAYNGAHHWNGSIDISAEQHHQLTSYGKRYLGDSKSTPTPAEISAFRVVIHEQLHGCSPAYLDHTTYATERGRQLEEVTTEMLARNITTQAFTDPDVTYTTGLHPMTTDGGSYGKEIFHCVSVVQDALNGGLSSAELYAANRKFVTSSEAVNLILKGCAVVKRDRSQVTGSPQTRITHGTDIFISAITDNPAAQAKMRAELWTCPGVMYPVQKKKEDS